MTIVMKRFIFGSVLQCVAVYCSLFHIEYDDSDEEVGVCQCVAVYCNLLQYVAKCCSVLQGLWTALVFGPCNTLQHTATYCNRCGMRLFFGLLPPKNKCVSHLI